MVIYLYKTYKYKRHISTLIIFLRLGIFFKGFANFFNAINNTAKLLNHWQTYTMEEFRNATDFICSRDLNQLTQLNVINEAGINEQFLINQCFLNVYTLTLLSRYGITSFDSLQFIDQVRLTFMLIGLALT